MTVTIRLARILSILTLVLLATAPRALPARATAAGGPSAPHCPCHLGQSAEHHSPVTVHLESAADHPGQTLAAGECTRCNGCRRCSVCDGSGKNNSGDACSICNGSGKCYFCGGSGKSS